MLKFRVFLPTALLAIGCASSPVAAPENADEAVRRVIEGLEQKKAEVIWQALPGSYQVDVNDLVHAAAANADAEVWNGAFRVLGKAVRVLDEKRSFIQENPMVAAKLSETEGSADAYDAVVKLLGTITASELSDIEKLRTIDVGEFMAGTVSKAMVQLEALGKLSPESAQEVEELGSSKVTLVSQDGDRAVVRIEGSKKSEDTEFVRVEGKWIPAELAKDWKSNVEEMRVKMADLPGQKDSENNAEILQAMSQVESGLDSLLAAQTADEFEGAAQALVGMVMFRFAGAMADSAGEEEDPGNR